MSRDSSTSVFFASLRLGVLALSIPHCTQRKAPRPRIATGVLESFSHSGNHIFVSASGVSGLLGSNHSGLNSIRRF